jgi:hypothetical protein
VEKESADLHLENETLLPIKADHRAMCRFAESDSQKYLVVWEAIAGMVRGSAKHQPGGLTTSFAFCMCSLGSISPSSADNILSAVSNNSE